MKQFFTLLFVLFVIGAKAQIVNIPDANFKSFLLNYFPRIDTNFDNEIDVNEAAAFNINPFYINNSSITDLTGIQAFTSIIDLNISQCAISNFNLAGMPQLDRLTVNATPLSTLDLTALSGLTSINVNFNYQLTSLNVNGLVNLTSLVCDNNMLTVLDVSSLTNLTGLNCGYNNLTALNVNNLTNLTGFSCKMNHITSLNVNGLPNLSGIECTDNDLTSLTITNCPALSNLYCGSMSNSSTINRLTQLDLSGLPNLTILNCDNNLLTTLDFTNCPNIQGVYCRNNTLTSINVRGLTHLTQLSLPGNLLTSIDVTGCSTLSYLDCQNNQLTSLDLSTCSNFEQLLCANNQLTSLNISGVSNLTHLLCNQNLLTSIDVSGAPSLQYLYCPDNQLTSLNLKNGPSVITSFIASNNPALQYVCADEAELTTLEGLLIQQGFQNVNVNSYCSFTPGGSFNTINGVLKIDVDNNGCGQADPVLPQYMVKINDGTNIGYTSTNNLGAFSFFTNAGNFTITPQTQNPYFTVTPSSAVVNFSSAGGNIQTADFCISPNGVHNDIDVTLIPISRARPGFDATYKLVYSNKGTTTLSGNVELVFDDGKMNFIVSTPAVTTQATGLLSWAYSSLHPFETRSIDIQFNVLPPPVNNINDSLFFTCNITPLAADETPLDNSFEMEQLITGSFDPNDKNCLEGDKIDITRVGDYVHYLVRFQNTGTDVAENVVITDILENNFNWNSLVIYQSSHPYKLKQSSGNKLEFIFEGINLPAVTVDEPGSHGFIAFKVRTAATLVLGDSVRNSAAIYFDFNLPVITNTTRSVIDSVKIIPVGIEYFKGVKQSGKNLLNWKVNCTSLQVKFNIERSTDGRNFAGLQSITASNTRCLQPFDFSDNNPASGMNYYRIKMTDIDGKVTYSSVIALLNKKSGFEIVNLTPNPVTNENALLNITSAEKQTVNILVTDASGKIVHSTYQPVIAGFTQVKLNFNNLATGVYTIAVYTNEGERKTVQFIKK